MYETTPFLPELGQAFFYWHRGGERLALFLIIRYFLSEEKASYCESNSCVVVVQPLKIHPCTYLCAPFLNRISLLLSLTFPFRSLMVFHGLRARTQAFSICSLLSGQCFHFVGSFCRGVFRWSLHTCGYFTFYFALSYLRYGLQQAGLYHYAHEQNLWNLHFFT